MPTRDKQVVLLRSLTHTLAAGRKAAYQSMASTSEPSLILQVSSVIIYDEAVHLWWCAVTEICAGPRMSYLQLMSWGHTSTIGESIQSQ